MSGTYFIHTLGCQSNKSDSERIAGDYAARGWTPAKSWRTADNIIVNTCAIRQSAEDRATGFLLNVVKYFDGKMKPKIILTGCMTHHGETHLRELLPMVDEILPVGEVGFNQQAIRKDKVHAWIPISEGCNSFCTYCIVPYSRGRERSRPLDEIVQEVERLVHEGYSEITLLGQNVNSWGLEKVGIGLRKLLMDREHKLKESDLPSNQSQYLRPNGVPPFVTLLREVSKYPTIKKVRFMSSNPWDFSDELITEIARNTKIDRFLHLPVQSGSNAVLKRMNRGYTREDYREIVKKLRAAVPDIEFGTDLIVGFPEETDQEFQETVDFAREIGWKVGFVARYSPRPGTASYRLYSDNVSPAEKKRRWKVLEDIINQPNLGIRRPKVIK
jgi:tRNA-2-methylthio-N6-dimethylallyladenosine synthase